MVNSAPEMGVLKVAAKAAAVPQARQMRPLPVLKLNIRVM